MLGIRLGCALKCRKSIFTPYEETPVKTFLSATGVL